MKASHAIIFFIIGTLMMATIYHHEILLFGFMLAASVGALAIDRWKNTKPFIIATLMGGICENTAVFLGGWSYSNANYLFAPLWLPVGWGMAVILLQEAFSKDVKVDFSKRAVALALGGTVMTGILSFSELLVFFLFMLVTAAFFFSGYFKRSEIRMGIMAAILGTAMETSCILAGNWEYSFAEFGTPIWLPLCWFNAFLIMRRIIN